MKDKKRRALSFIREGNTVSYRGMVAEVLEVFDDYIILDLGISGTERLYNNDVKMLCDEALLTECQEEGSNAER